MWKTCFNPVLSVFRATAPLRSWPSAAKSAAVHARSFQFPIPLVFSFEIQRVLACEFDPASTPLAARFCSLIRVFTLEVKRLSNCSVGGFSATSQDRKPPRPITQTPLFHARTHASHARVPRVKLKPTSCAPCSGPLFKTSSNTIPKHLREHNILRSRCLV